MAYHTLAELAWGGLSCWHRGHRIPSVSRVRLGAAGHDHAAPTRAAAGAGVPAVPWGTAPRPYPDPASGASRRLPLPVGPLASRLPSASVA